MAYGDIWRGWSNSHGGVVEFGTHPGGSDYQETEKVTITCYALDNSIRLVIEYETPKSFGVGDKIYFHVDDSEPVYANAELAFFGLWGAMPSAWISPSLLRALMQGTNLDIKLKGQPDETYYELHLTGTQYLFSRHLRACLD
jgi:hypothetical protein